MPPLNEPLMGPLDIRYEPLTVNYDNNTVTRATINADGLNYEMTTPMFDYLTLDNENIKRAEFEYKMNELKSNIYKTIIEHVKLDITEEEFMDLLKE